jgi:hypothetical protein
MVHSQRFLIRLNNTPHELITHLTTIRVHSISHFDLTTTPKTEQLLNLVPFAEPVMPALIQNSITHDPFSPSGNTSIHSMLSDIKNMPTLKNPFFSELKTLQQVKKTCQIQCYEQPKHYEECNKNCLQIIIYISTHRYSQLSQPFSISGSQHSILFLHGF